ncbi:MAG: TldD/PmbA family protein, partial [Pseudanabaenaceae cyanobacterium]
EVLCSGQWECSTTTTRLLNSQGLDVSFTETSVEAFLSGELVRGDDFLQVYVARSGNKFFEFSDLVDRLGQYIQWAERNVPAPQGNVPVILTPKVAELLWSVVSLAMNAKQVEQKSTPWLEKRGSQVVASAITWQQLPQFDHFYLPFDDEGTPTQTFTWIEQGVLQDFYTDRKLAAQLNLTPRGNGYRSLATSPTPSLFNVIVAAGDKSLQELVRTIDCGLLVDQVLGGGAGISGDFSVNVDLGYRIEGGEIVGRVKDTMIAGNVYNALQNVVLGNDREWQGNLYTPSVVVELAVSTRS